MPQPRVAAETTELSTNCSHVYQKPDRNQHTLTENLNTEKAQNSLKSNFSKSVKHVSFENCKVELKN